MFTGVPAGTIFPPFPGTISSDLSAPASPNAALPRPPLRAPDRAPGLTAPPASPPPAPPPRTSPRLRPRTRLSPAPHYASRIGFLGSQDHRYALRPCFFL